MGGINTTMTKPPGMIFCVTFKNHYIPISLFKENVFETFNYNYVGGCVYDD